MTQLENEKSLILKIKNDLKNKNLEELQKDEKFKNLIENNVEILIYDPKNANISEFLFKINKLLPNLIIDDLIKEAFNSLDNMIDKENYKVSELANFENSNEYKKFDSSAIKILEWTYNILQLKSMKRSILKFIFDKILYLDCSDNTYRFLILKEIIKAYSLSDQLILNKDIRKKIEDCKMLLKNVESDDDLEILKANDFIDLPNCKKEAVNKLKKFVEIQEKRIVPFENKIGITEEVFYLNFIDTEEPHKNNTMVLSNLIWEELILYFDEENNETEIKQIINLFCVIINETKEFFRGRIFSNKKILNKILEKDSSSDFVEKMVLNFSDLSKIKNELENFFEKNKNSNKIERIYNIFLSKIQE